MKNRTWDVLKYNISIHMYVSNRIERFNSIVLLFFRMMRVFFFLVFLLRAWMCRNEHDADLYSPVSERHFA